jgi:hypothetical protein
MYTRLFEVLESFTSEGSIDVEEELDEVPAKTLAMNKG